MANEPPLSTLVAGSVSVSAPGATLEVRRLKLTPAGRRALTVGGGQLPNGDILLSISRAQRPFCESPAVLDYYDGPLLMVLSSPLWGSLLALALPDEEGAWPFLLAPITDAELAALKRHGPGVTSPSGGRGVREHFIEAETMYLLRDYGAQDLVASPVGAPLPEDWLPMPGY